MNYFLRTKGLNHRLFTSIFGGFIRYHYEEPSIYLLMSSINSHILQLLLWNGKEEWNAVVIIGIGLIILGVVLVMKGSN